MVLPPAGIDAFRIEIHIVERLVSDRPVCEPVLAVEGHIFGLLREADLVVLVHKGGDIGPVEHRVVVEGGVHQPSADFDH